MMSAVDWQEHLRALPIQNFLRKVGRKELIQHLIELNDVLLLGMKERTNDIGTTFNETSPIV
jgi:hypothetical protein